VLKRLVLTELGSDRAEGLLPTHVVVFSDFGVGVHDAGFDSDRLPLSSGLRQALRIGKAFSVLLIRAGLFNSIISFTRDLILCGLLLTRVDLFHDHRHRIVYQEAIRRGVVAAGCEVLGGVLLVLVVGHGEGLNVGLH
jgi:hypothetical protein